MFSSRRFCCALMSFSSESKPLFAYSQSTSARATMFWLARFIMLLAHPADTDERDVEGVARRFESTSEHAAWHDGEARTGEADVGDELPARRIFWFGHHFLSRGAPPPLADTLAPWCSRVSRTERHFSSRTRMFRNASGQPRRSSTRSSARSCRTRPC